MRFFDSHAHLNLPQFEADLDATVDRARAAGVTRAVNVGVDAETSLLARDLSRRYEGLHASAAVHPNYVAEKGEEGFAAVEHLLRNGGFVAVGETGLDYYRKHSPHELQRAAFRRHIALADELDLPVIVHCREAHADCRRILTDEASRRDLAGRVILHCFGGSTDDARAYVDMGLIVSFAAVITYPNAKLTREAAALVPPGMTLAETDCPFLAPQAYRGKRNEPAHVVHAVAELARIHGLPAEEMARITTENACRVFNLEVGE